MESDHSQEPVSDFHFTPRTLLDMAVSKYAFISWRYNISYLPHLPTSIRSMINEKIQSISKEIKNWHKNSGRFVGDIPRKVMINCVAFNAAGDICSRRTVKNLLATNLLEIDSMKQFEIACEFCIKEDVERLWPLVKDEKLFHENRFEFSHEASSDERNYWCSRMRGQLKKFYGSEEKSPEWYMISNDEVPFFYWLNSAALEYFWCKLNTQEKHSLVDRILESYPDDYFYDAIYFQSPNYDRKLSSRMMMNSYDTVLRNCVSKWPVLIEHFAIDDVYCQYALQLWNYGKSSIFEGVAFFDILFRLSTMAYKCEYESVAIVLKEIWRSAPDHLKNYVTSNEDDDHVESLFHVCLRYTNTSSFGRDLGFLFDLLKDASFEIRLQVWRSWWLKLAGFAKVPNLREFMTLCFENVNDIVKFKKTEMLDYEIMRYNFVNFVRSELFVELSEYLMFCCSDANDEKLARIVRTRIILEHMDWINERDSDSTLSKFFKFFDGCFTLSEAAELLECHLPDKDTSLLLLWISFSCFKSFKRLLRCLKFSHQRLMELKRFFRERCLHVLTFGNFNSLSVDDWDKFLKWCGLSPEELSELRCSIRIDNLMENFLINVYKSSVF
ncbi:uncharacterized protein LOC135849283 [Planococcus citri]|uniref:uncharacterized protein LOC135849283 n=1 Tax=Planococcus citri TaxID=170843 RepID=UPI0031F88E91